MRRNGVLGEEAIAPTELLGEYPAKLSPVETGAIWLQYLTAYGALVTFGGIKRGDFCIAYSRVQQCQTGGHPTPRMWRARY
jgi:NADPH:quinone reductase-like Zn-dependent oxidoreductase